MARRSAEQVADGLREGRYRIVERGDIFRRADGSWGAYYSYQWRQGAGWSRVVRRKDNLISGRTARRLDAYMRRDLPPDNYDFWQETP